MVPAVVDVLLGLAVLLVLGSSVGILVMPEVYQKVHYVTPASLVAPVLVAVAILIHSGWSTRSAQTWLALLVVVIAGPVLAHATMRAARIRETGDWRDAAGTARSGPDEDPR